MPTTSDRSSRGSAPYSEITDGALEADRQRVADTEHVLGVDRRVVARAARGDDDMIDAARADRVGQRADDLGRPAQEAGGDLGLLEDLVAETHEAMASGPPPGRLRPDRHPRTLRPIAGDSAEPPDP